MVGIPTVYADESSNTGENLLDPAQPVYCVSGVLLGRALAEQIVDRVRMKLPAGMNEPKYTTLSRAEWGRDALLEAFEALSGQTVRAFPVHKRFMVAAKIVDMLIEELAHENGYDMYADGAARSLAHLLHVAGPVLGDADAYERLLRTFVQVVRRNWQADVDDLFDAIEKYLAGADPQWAETIGLLAFTRGPADQLVAQIRAGQMYEVLNPAVPSLVALCLHMGASVGDFELVHDESKTVQGQLGVLLNLHKLPDPTWPGQLLAPLPANRISFANSAAVPELQVADWVAGAARQWATAVATDRTDPFAQQLAGFVQPWMVDALWPDPEAIGASSR